MIRNYFFPKIDEDVQQLMDRNGIKSLETISLIVAVFESVALLLFMLTRKGFGYSEMMSFISVMLCIVTCFVIFILSKILLKSETLKHISVVMINTSYYLIMAAWSMWSSYRRYELGEQILTFYAVEVMLVCFIVLQPWFSIIITFITYAALYVMLYSVDKAAGAYFVNFFILGVMCAVGMTVRYHGLLKTTEATIQLRKSKDSEIKDKMNILQSIADIYDRVNLIDFTDCTEMSVRDKEQNKIDIDLNSQSHSAMTLNMRKRIVPDQIDNFIEYTDLTTIRARLTGRKLLSSDYIDYADGWFRAQYIPVDSDEDGVPQRIVFTTRNVDEEKRREKHLYKIAMTDELTRLFNRRSFEEDLEAYKERGIDKDFVMLCADVNGLKKVNDTKGHAGGDELIKAAADCLLMGIGGRGKVYRTGGDEFVAILHTDDPGSVQREIEELVDKWQGKYSDKLSISLGFAAHADNESLSIHELEKKADREMYAAKAGYYERNGIDRRSVN